MEVDTMARGRTAANDYKDCISVMIPIPKELHRELKVQCTKEGVTMKEILYDSNIKAIKDKLGVK